MPHHNRRYRPDYRSLLKEAWTPGDAVQFDAIVGACALVAHADGWVTLDERRKLTERFCAIEDLAIFGPEEALEAFDRMIDLFDRDPEIARSDAEAAVAKLRSHPLAARRLVATACGVAAADGGFDEAERDIVLRICEILNVPPVEFELIAAPV